MADPRDLNPLRQAVDALNENPDFNADVDRYASLYGVDPQVARRGMLEIKLESDGLLQRREGFDPQNPTAADRLFMARQDYEDASGGFPNPLLRRLSNFAPGTNVLLDIARPFTDDDQADADQVINTRARLLTNLNNRKRSLERAQETGLQLGSGFSAWNAALGGETEQEGIAKTLRETEQQIESLTRRNFEELPSYDRVVEAQRRILQGIGDVVQIDPTAPGAVTAGPAVNRVLGNIESMISGEPIEDTYFMRRAEGQEAAMEALLPVAAETEIFFESQFARGLGTALPTLAAAGTGAVAAPAVGATGVAAFAMSNAPAALVAAFQLGAEGDRDAEQADATDQQRRIATFSNMAMAPLEAIPFTRFTRHIGLGSQLAGKGFRNPILRLAADTTSQGVIEAGTEAFQTVGSNYIARHIAAYDPDRALGEGVMESALVGFALGGFFGAAGSPFSGPGQAEFSHEDMAAAAVPGVFSNPDRLYNALSRFVPEKQREALRGWAEDFASEVKRFRANGAAQRRAARMAQKDAETGGLIHNGEFFGSDTGEGGLTWGRIDTDGTARSVNGRFINITEETSDIAQQQMGFEGPVPFEELRNIPREQLLAQAKRGNFDGYILNGVLHTDLETSTQQVGADVDVEPYESRTQIWRQLQTENQKKNVRPRDARRYITGQAVTDAIPDLFDRTIRVSTPADVGDTQEMGVVFDEEGEADVAGGFISRWEEDTNQIVVNPGDVDGAAEALGEMAFSGSEMIDANIRAFGKMLGLIEPEEGPPNPPAPRDDVQMELPLEAVEAEPAPEPEDAELVMPEQSAPPFDPLDRRQLESASNADVISWWMSGSVEKTAVDDLVVGDARLAGLETDTPDGRITMTLAFVGSVGEGMRLAPDFDLDGNMSGGGGGAGSGSRVMSAATNLLKGFVLAHGDTVSSIEFSGATDAHTKLYKAIVKRVAQPGSSYVLLRTRPRPTGFGKKDSSGRNDKVEIVYVPNTANVEAVIQEKRNTTDGTITVEERQDFDEQSAGQGIRRGGGRAGQPDPRGQAADAGGQEADAGVQRPQVSFEGGEGALDPVLRKRILRRLGLALVSNVNMPPGFRDALLADLRMRGRPDLATGFDRLSRAYGRLAHTPRTVANAASERIKASSRRVIREVMDQGITEAAARTGMTMAARFSRWLDVAMTNRYKGVDQMLLSLKEQLGRLNVPKDRVEALERMIDNIRLDAQLIMNIRNRSVDSFLRGIAPSREDIANVLREAEDAGLSLDDTWRLMGSSLRRPSAGMDAIFNEAFGSRPTEDQIEDFSNYLINRRLIFLYEKSQYLLEQAEAARARGDASAARSFMEDYHSVADMDSESLAILQAEVDRIEADPANFGYRRASEMITELMNSTLIKLSQAGIITKEDAAQMITNNSVYVPFGRLGFDDGMNNLRAMTDNSRRDIGDPIVNIGAMIHQAEYLIARNRMVNRLRDAYEQFGDILPPGMFTVIEGKRVTPQDVTNPVQDIYRALSKLESDRPGALHFLRELARQIAEGTGSVRSRGAARNFSMQEPDITEAAAQRSMIGYRNGERFVVKLEASEEADLMLFAYYADPTTLIEGKLAGLTRPLAWTSIAMRIGVTATPEFAAASLARDMQTNFAFLPLKPKDIGRQLLMTGQMMVSELMRGIRRDVAVARGGRIPIEKDVGEDAVYTWLGGLAGIQSAAISSLQNPRVMRDGVIRKGRFLQTVSGAAIAGAAGFVTGLLSGNPSKAISQAVSGAMMGALFGASGGSFTSAGSNLIRTFDAQERASRLNIMKSVAREYEAQGYSRADAILKAFFESQDIANFDARGVVTNYLAPFIPFFNASIQGLRRAIRAVSRMSPAQALRIRKLMIDGRWDEATKQEIEDAKAVIRVYAVMGVYAAWGVMSALAYLALDEEEYIAIPERIRRTHLNIPMNDQGVSLNVPVGFDFLQMAYGAGTRIAESIHFQNPAMSATVLTGIAEDAGNYLVPPFVQDIPLLSTLEVAMNRDFSTGLPIRSRSTEGLVPEDRYTDYTTQGAINIAKAVSEMPLPIRNTLTDMGLGDPQNVQHLITTIFGSYGRYLLGDRNGVIESGIEDQFFFRRFMTDSSRQSGIRSEFMDHRYNEDNTEALAGSLRQAIQRGDRARYEQLINDPRYTPREVVGARVRAEGWSEGRQGDLIDTWAGELVSEIDNIRMELTQGYINTHPDEEGVRTYLDMEAYDLNIIRGRLGDAQNAAMWESLRLSGVQPYANTDPRPDPFGALDAQYPEIASLVRARMSRANIDNLHVARLKHESVVSVSRHVRETVFPRPTQQRTRSN